MFDGTSVQYPRTYEADAAELRKERTGLHESHENQKASLLATAQDSHRTHWHQQRALVHGLNALNQNHPGLVDKITSSVQETKAPSADPWMQMFVAQEQEKAVRFFKRTGLNPGQQTRQPRARRSSAAASSSSSASSS
jgi:hypothetical protein